MPYLVKPSDRSAAVTTAVPVDDSLPRACIIGAGSSGIAAAKALHLAGIPFDCFEAGSAIGGNWVFDNPIGRSACYETLEINTSCPSMAFSDFPMPISYPAYARHDQVHAYFEQYVDHFGFREKITFNTTVTWVTQEPDGTWLVHTDGPEGARSRTYDAVLVANGHHWDPRWPDPAYPSDFDGEQIHAHNDRSGDQLEGRDVVVVGAGNSAMDIAVEGSHRARSVNLSIRRGQWVMKKWLLGRPSDQIALPGWAPWWVTALRLRIGALTSGWARALRASDTTTPTGPVSPRAIRPHQRPHCSGARDRAPRHRTTRRRRRGVHGRHTRTSRSDRVGDGVQRHWSRSSTAADEESLGGGSMSVGREVQGRAVAVIGGANGIVAEIAR